MTESDVYLLGRTQVEEERLGKQVQELAGEAQWLLDQLHIPQGARAIDLGCGPQGVLDLLSERVGPGGTVVGLETSGHFVAAARQFAAQRHLANVEILPGVDYTGAQGFRLRPGVDAAGCMTAWPTWI